MAVNTTDTTQGGKPETMIAWLAAGVAAFGLAIAFLAFTPWLRITGFAEFLGPFTQNVNGYDVYGMTALGDGIAVTALGAIAAALALALFRLPDWRQLLASGIAIAGLIIFGIALHDALYDWTGGLTVVPGPRPDVNVAVGLWLTLAFSLTIAVAGLVLISLTYVRKTDESEQEKAKVWA